MGFVDIDRSSDFMMHACIVCKMRHTQREREEEHVCVYSKFQNGE